MEKLVSLMIIYPLQVLTLIASSSVASSYKVRTIFTFGDSILDAGNNHFIKNCTLQADFPPYGSSFFHHPTGRFTNGRTVVDFLSEYLGIDFQKPYLQVEKEVVNGSRKDYPSNGINFASAGSGVFRETNKEHGVISIHDQLQQFETLMKSNKIDKKLVQKSLFLFEAGSNDIFNYFSPFQTPKLCPEAFADAMLMEVKHWISRTYQLGARRFGIISLGSVGCVPARVLFPGAPIDHCDERMNQMVIKYNLGLEAFVKDMPRKYPATLSVYGAVYDMVQLLRATPKRYGFVNTSGACCGGGTLGGMIQCGKEGYKLCENPNEFLFWDLFHPSEHANELFSKALWDGKKSEIRPFNLKTLASMTLDPSKLKYRNGYWSI